MKNIIEFPNLGWKFTVNETAFTIFNIEIKWYALILTLGIVLAVMYVLYRAKQQGIPTDCVVDYAIVTVICGIVGARLYYVLTTLGEYDSFLDMINIRNGGLAIYGSIIGGGLAVVITALVKRMKVLNMLDIVAPSVMLGQIVGRWGNFMNGEAYGAITDKYVFFTRSFTQKGCEKLPWIMKVTEENDGVVHGSVTAHPAFLYEGIWNLIGFILINIFYKKKKANGQIFYAYIAWYGLGRCVVEGFRSDSLTVGNIRISQLLGFVCFIAGGILLLFSRKIAKGVCGEPRAKEIADAIAAKNGNSSRKKTTDTKKSTEEDDIPKDADETEETVKEESENGEDN